jgi:DnaJ-class molecular chaperone
MNPDDATAEKKFQEVQSAFEVLSDTDKRKRYDQFGSDFDAAGAAGGHPGGYRYTTSSGPQTYPFDVNDLNDVLAAAVRRGGRWRVSRICLSNSIAGVGRAACSGRAWSETISAMSLRFRSSAVLGGEAALTVQRQMGISRRFK